MSPLRLPRPLRRRSALAGDEALDLPAIFRRLDLGREAVSSIVSSGRNSDSVSRAGPPVVLRPTVVGEDMVSSEDLVFSGSSSGRGLYQPSQAEAVGAVGSVEKESHEDASGHKSVGSSAVEQAEWRLFTPSSIDPLRCMARTWADGRGGQCRKAKVAGERFCRGCAKKQAHGAVDGPIPEKKLIEFRKQAQQRAQVGEGVQAGKGACGSVDRFVGKDDSVESSKEPTVDSHAAFPSGVANSSFVRVPRRTEIAGMSGILAENQYVEREMERRSFQRRDGQWVGGDLLPGDPSDGVDLESFLRRQFQAQEGAARATAWGPGRTLGRS